MTAHSASARRMPRALTALALGLALTAATGTAAAHHAFSAEFDADQPIDISGVVTKAKWVNPHSWLYFDVKGPDGAETNWGVEFGAPFALQERGLTKAVLPPGTPVRVKGYRSKNGGPYGYAVTVTLQDGRSFQTGGAQDSPTAPATR
ncbi:DUF6152 family protein [Derxia lacustris]|uniref:DUF6152 family protein n=1 Tax=Derxia lacustris TaxID=764842 RepID=UPI0022870B36|nr:DUF6152 family protein [Derxia lacustris]